jgi:hypothetical protein
MDALCSKWVQQEEGEEEEEEEEKKSIIPTVLEMLL